MKRWLLTSAALGLFASALAYAILLTTDQSNIVRLVAMLIWPTGLFLLANEGAATSREVAANFAKAIGGNVVLYAALGTLLFGVRTVVQKLTRE